MNEGKVHRNPKHTTLLEFPSGSGKLSVVENFGEWNELQTPQMSFIVDCGPGRSLQVDSIPAQALAQVAFRLLKTVKDHLSESTLERLFEQELGPFVTID